MKKNNYVEEVKDYFKDKAAEYDLVENQIYWVLSDKLLWDIWDKMSLSKIKNSIHFLDAGGGTGRWSIKLLEAYKDSKGTIIDLSQPMLNEAKKKSENMHLSNRLTLVNDNLDSCTINEKYNMIFSFHNVLGFVNDAEKVLKKLADSLTDGGYLVCVVPNYFHGIFFNVFVGDLELADNCLHSSKGKFTRNMPEMRFFRPKELEEIYKNLGLKIEGLYGFPVSIYPGMQETQLRGQSENLSDLLSSKNNFDKIYNLEKHLSLSAEAAARGNNLIIIGKKEEIK